MDFVASREEEMRYGWRSRVSRFLKGLGVLVLDPWFKPDVMGFHEYGKEAPSSQEKIKRLWTFRRGKDGLKRRGRCAGGFWETLHIDLRMVDTADFLIAYCPTNIYSVGTAHEIVLARSQRKPVLFVSPRVEFPSLAGLRRHLHGDEAGLALLHTLENEVPIKPNPLGIPSLWYMPLVGGHNFFDGFGFYRFQGEFRWKSGTLDERERKHRPQRPLLPFLRTLNRQIPPRYDSVRGYVRDDDWLLWDLGRRDGRRPRKNTEAWR